jgi:hypothetical protein
VGWLLEKDLEAWRNTVREALADVPSEYADGKKALQMISRVFHEELAKAWQPVLSHHFDVCRLDSDLALQQFQRQILQDLQDLHLAFQCPKTKRPAILTLAGRPADKPVGRFRLQTREGEGRPKVTTAIDVDSDFLLMEDIREGRRMLGRDIGR